MTDFRKVAESIIKIEVEPDKTIGQLYDEFFAIMREHGIKQGTPSEDGRGLHCNDYIWTMCSELFFGRLAEEAKYQFLLGAVPEDIQGWAKPRPKPRRKQSHTDRGTLADVRRPPRMEFR